MTASLITIPLTLRCGLSTPHLNISPQAAIQSFSLLKLLPAIRWIVDCYYHGAKFGIHADADGLITGGNEQTQLTWMDAKCGDTVFTPRHGKAVEINALWYNAVRRLSGYYADKDDKLQSSYQAMAEKNRSKFRQVFWNRQRAVYMIAFCRTARRMRVSVPIKSLLFHFRFHR